MMPDIEKNNQHWIELIATLDSVRFVDLPCERRKAICDAVKEAMELIRVQLRQKSNCEKDQSFRLFVATQSQEKYRISNHSSNMNICPMCGKKLDE